MTTIDTSTARFAGHTPGPFYVGQCAPQRDNDPRQRTIGLAPGGPVEGPSGFASNDDACADQGYLLVDGIIDEPTAQLFAAAPALLHERDKLRAQVAALREANARLVQSLRCRGQSLIEAASLFGVEGYEDADRQCEQSGRMAFLAASENEDPDALARQQTT